MGIDTTTAALILSTILSALFTAILIVFVILQRRSSRELATTAGKLVSAVEQLQTTNLIVGQNTTSLADSTKTFYLAVQALTSATHSLAKIEVEPRLEYAMKKKDMALGGIEFELVNKGKGMAHSVKVTPVSSKGTKLGLSFLNIQKSDISVGEARSYLLTLVKAGDLISLNVEFKDDFGETVAPQTFIVDAS